MLVNSLISYKNALISFACDKLYRRLLHNMDIAEEDEGESSSDHEEALTARQIPITRSKEVKNPLRTHLASTLESPMNKYWRSGEQERINLEMKLSELQEEYSGLKHIKRCLRETEAVVSKLSSDLRQAKAKKEMLLKQVQLPLDIRRSFLDDLEEPSPHLPVPLSAQVQQRARQSAFPLVEREMRELRSKLERLVRI